MDMASDGFHVDASMHANRCTWIALCRLPGEEVTSESSRRHVRVAVPRCVFSRGKARLQAVVTLTVPCI